MEIECENCANYDRIGRHCMVLEYLPHSLLQCYQPVDMKIYEQTVDEPITILSKERYEKYKKDSDVLKQIQSDNKEAVKKLANEQFEDWLHDHGRMQVRVLIENQRLCSDPICTSFYAGGKDRPDIYRDINLNIRCMFEKLIKPIQEDTKAYIDKQYKILKNYRKTTLILGILFIISFITNLCLL